MTGGGGRHPLGLCTARRAPSGPFSSRPGPRRGPPLGCVPAPRPPFVQWAHTALPWPGVWPGGSLISRAQAERAWGHLFWAPLPPGLLTSVQSPRRRQLSPHVARVCTHRHACTHVPTLTLPCPGRSPAPGPLPVLFWTGRLLPTWGSGRGCRAPQTEPPLTDGALVLLVVSASEGFLTSGKNL